MLLDIYSPHTGFRNKLQSPLSLPAAHQTTVVCKVGKKIQKLGRSSKVDLLKAHPDMLAILQIQLPLASMSG